MQKTTRELPLKTLSSKNVNLIFLLKELSIKYKSAYSHFTTSYPDKTEKSIETFIKSWKLRVKRTKTVALKQNYAGTYSYRITMSDQLREKLGRESGTFAYYGMNSYNSAYEKSVVKCFHIINCLLTNTQLTEIEKRR